MNWITTNIRLPEDLYMDLKMEAARKRKSVAEIVRNKIAKKKILPKKRSIEKQIQELNKFAEKIAKQNPGLDLTKALIEMRYEQ